ncbi:hypothetical protein PJO48_29390, partial [Mycobacterium kansasii]
NALYKESCKIVVKLKLQKEKFLKLKENFESLVLEKSHISDCFEKSNCDLEFKNSQICDLKSEVERLKNEVSSLLSLKDTWKYAQGDPKLEKLLSGSRKTSDRTGLGYDKNMSPKRKNTPPVFVKGESSNSKGKNTYQSFSRISKTIQKPK